MWFFNYNRPMFFSPLRRHFTVWIAMLAILFSALAPAVSHALEARQGNANWVEICTVAGTKMVQLGNGDQPTSDALSHHLKNCPYCAAHAGGPALPPVAPVTFAILGGHDVFPALFYTAPSVQFAWSASAPRGPPALV
jgi:hypothetical protein